MIITSGVEIPIRNQQRFDGYRFSQVERSHGLMVDRLSSGLTRSTMTLVGP